MSPDTQQNLFYTVYFTLSHNWLPIFYALCIVASTLLALWRPKRAFILFMIGFSILLFSFEYTKHIQEGLLQQTQQSLITERQSATIARVLHLTFNRAIPYLAPLVGWATIIVGSILLYRERRTTLQKPKANS